MEKSKSQKTAIIIGAGLTVAYKFLKETNIKPLIIEESEFIGGISRTEVFNGNRIDIGGHRFFSKNKDILKIWEELLPIQSKPSKDDTLLKINKNLPKKGPNPEKTDNVMLIRNRVSRIFFLQKFFDYPIKINPQIFVNMGLFRTINSGLGYIFSSLKKRKENSLEDFYINRFGKPLYKMFFEDYTQKVWGVHPSEISPEWGSQRVKGLSLSKALKNMIFSTFSKKYKTSETSLIEQFLYPKFGPGQLWHQMVKYITDNGGKIIFNAKVFNINRKQFYKKFRIQNTG